MDAAIALFKSMTNTFKTIWGRVKRAILSIFNVARKVPGYRRMSRKSELDRYASIAHNKSNNWRRMHGLPIIRKRSLT